MGKTKRDRTPSVERSRSKKKKRHRSKSDSKHRKKKSKEKKRKRHRDRSRSSSSSSDSSVSSSSSSSSSSEREVKKKKKKHKHKHKKKNRTDSVKASEAEVTSIAAAGKNIIGPVLPANLNKKEENAAKVKPSGSMMKPMTKEEWEKQQSVVRRVYDPETGRNRLVKGDGEIIEEIVSKDRHKEINKQATRGDGAFYSSQLGLQNR